MTAIRIELLGKLRFTFGQHVITTVNTNRMRSLLAFLLLNSDAAQSREHLAFLLWPESGEAQARTNLRQLLHNLRRALPVECSLLVTDNQSVRWRPDPSCAIDVFEFEAAVQAAEAAKDGDLTVAREALEQAARLYQDDLLPDLYDDWLQAKRGQLRLQLAEVLARLASLLDKVGDYPAGIRHATRLVALDPLREAYYQALMRLHIRNHDRSSALRVYHQCMRNLQRELGVSPGKATQDLFMQALKSEALPNAASAELPPYAATRPLPMVGRKAEWARLLDSWRVVTEGEAHLALIMGEPGIGKSRLAEELLDSCSRDSNCAVARGRCYFAQGQLAYGPVTELLRAEPMRRARAQLPKSQLAELVRVLPEILVENPEIAPPQPLTESWQRLHLYEALNSIFRKASKPLLLLFDDLQWCDQDSFEWLHSLFRSGAAAGVLVLGTVRPEETGRDHPLSSLVRLLRQSGQLSEFLIAPLNAEDTAALAAQIATRECDPEFLSGLYRATKGNPLFVVESVRASLEDQTERSVPPRVQAVIAARLAQLSPPAYELAGLAATIGQPFSFDLLAKATDWDEDSLSRALEELWQRRIIDGQGAATYDYTHDLLRDVASGELSPIRRRSWHRRVARALEELHAPNLEGISGRLAAHCEAGGMTEQAIRFYGIAASVARQRFADAESADLLRRALRICQDLPETAKRDMEELELLLVLGPSLVTTGGYSMPEVGETYDRGLLLSKRSGDQKHLFSLLSGAWLFHIVRGELEESRRLAQSCVDGAGREGVPAQQMAGHFLLGTTLFHLGDLAASWKHIDLAASVSDGPSHPALALFAGPDVGVFCRAYVSHLLCQFDHDEQALAKSDEAIARARDVKHPFTLGIALDYAAMLNVYRRQSKLALVRAGEASAICRKHGFVYYLALAEIFAGWATAMEGNTSDGLTQLRRGLDALRATGAELRLPFYYGLLAEVCGLAGRLSDALANIASGFAFLSKNGESWSAPELHRIHGDLLLLTGDVSQSQVSYRRAIESAQKTGARLFELRAAARLR